ncbi:MAG TPA: hypothetical protein PKZ84_03635 [Anaerolineae bacterium]|nr:hypothetical protein [Anaerolineae bacterium]HQI86011.1 hypothetical protein [Anaerolineae bacterium]
MPDKDLRQAVAAFVGQLKDRVQPLIDDVTSVEISTYAAAAPLLESVVTAEDIGIFAQRQGYTRVAFQCDMSGCLETGRTDDVDASVRPMHSSTVAQALAEREKLLTVGLGALASLGVKPG